MPKIEQKKEKIIIISKIVGKTETTKLFEKIPNFLGR
jgi:hypothetical protein